MFLLFHFSVGRGKPRPYGMVGPFRPDAHVSEMARLRAAEGVGPYDVCRIKE